MQPFGRLDVPVPLPDQENGWIRKGGKHGWYLSGANAYPLEQRLFESDLRQLVRDYVLPGHTPQRPVLEIADAVVTLGSCFARELRAFLTKAGANAQPFWIPSGLNNTFAILDFFSWCVTGHETGRGYRYERDASGSAISTRSRRRARSSLRWDSPRSGRIGRPAAYSGAACPPRFSTKIATCSG